MFKVCLHCDLVDVFSEDSECLCFFVVLVVKPYLCLGNFIKHFEALSVEGWCPIISAVGVVYLCECSSPIL